MADASVFSQPHTCTWMNKQGCVGPVCHAASLCVYTLDDVMFNRALLVIMHLFDSFLLVCHNQHNIIRTFVYLTSNLERT